jgi:hypothetical protein
MVGIDFFHRHLALLLDRLRPVWFYTGDDDECRLACGPRFNHSEEVVASWMEQIMEVKDVAVALLPKEFQSLCEDPEHHAILDGLLATNEWGLILARMLQGGGRASGHGGGMQVAPSGGVVIRKSGSDPATRATSPTINEGWISGASEGTSDPLGSQSASASSPPCRWTPCLVHPHCPHHRTQGMLARDIPAMAEIGATSRHPSSPKRPQI